MLRTNGHRRTGKKGREDIVKQDPTEEAARQLTPVLDA